MGCLTSMDDLLECMLLDASVEPRDLPISFLETVTNNFSDEQKIGNGGYADVYKGVLQNGAVVAVKRLFSTRAIDEDKFIEEVGCLMKAKNKNVVRFLGYCSDTVGKMMNYKGKLIQAEERQRLLCFEYLPKGSLDQYITGASEGLEWGTRYKIIKGICAGLHCLHQDNHIVHSDLKPANILLNEDMVPKIADFGLSRCFNDKQSRVITSNLAGTLGYLAPESYDGVITFKSDIYSLGVIIMEILTGQKGYCDIKNVLEKWRSRLEETSQQVDVWLEQMQACADIGKKCIDRNPEERPDTLYILETLDDMERTYGFVKIDTCTSSATQVQWVAYSPGPSWWYKTIEVRKGSRNKADGSSCEVPLMSAPAAPCPLQRITGVPKGPGETSTQGSSEISKLLDVHPLELRFPFEPNKRIKCPVTLTNRTDHYVASLIIPTCQYTRIHVSSSYFHFQTMEPHSTCTIAMSLQEDLELEPQYIGSFHVLMIIVASMKDFRKVELFSSSNLTVDSEFLKRVEGQGGDVYQAILTAVICDPTSCHPVVTHQTIDYETICDVPHQLNPGTVRFMDVHPTETWILASHEGDCVSIWNYKTKERVMVLQVTGDSSTPDAPKNCCSVKFIAREEWFATGDKEGNVHVYAYTTMQKVKQFEAHRLHDVYSLAVHPTDPLLLTAALHSHSIKLWDWNQGWKCTREFHHMWAFYLRWNPQDPNTFASSGDFRHKFEAKVWNVHSSSPVATLCPMSICDFLYTDTSNNYIMISDDRSSKLDGIKIWDLQEKKRIHKLGMEENNSAHIVACHPTLPVFATIVGPLKSYLCLWDSTTYRLEKIVLTRNYASDVVFLCTKDSLRLFIKCHSGIDIVEIDLPLSGQMN